MSSGDKGTANKNCTYPKREHLEPLQMTYPEAVGNTYSKPVRIINPKRDRKQDHGSPGKNSSFRRSAERFAAWGGVPATLVIIIMIICVKHFGKSEVGQVTF